MTKLTRESNGNLSLQLTISWPAISKEFSKALESAVSQAELPGFRKGKAPRDLVEPKLDKTKLYSQAIEQLLPPAYSASIKEHDLKPILNPQVNLVSGEENHDWQFSAITCELPTVTIDPTYEQAIPKLELKKDEEKLIPIVAWLRDHSQLQVPDILVEQEANHRLAALAENVTKLGMTMDAYLQAKKITIEDLTSQSATESRTDLATEFILEELRKTKSLKTRKETLDFLLGLV